MIGKYTVGKKVLKFGYKRFGIPGAVASGGAALLGYLAVKRALKSKTGRGNVESVIDPGAIKSAVDEKGLSAIGDRETLEAAIDEEQLDSDVPIGEVGSAAESEADDLSTGADSEATNIDIDGDDSDTEDVGNADGKAA